MSNEDVPASSAPVPLTVGHQAGFQAALIDLDGTLLDTVLDLHAAVAEVCVHFGLPEVSVKDVRGWIGKGSRQLLVRLLSRPSGSEHRVQVDADAALNVFIDRYTKTNGRHARVFPGVIAGLQSMRQAKLRLACVTNKLQSATDHLLEVAGLARYFDCVIGGSSARALKPAPDALLAACAALGCSAQQAVMIGDSENDLLAARAAGCACVLLPYGYSEGQPVQSLGADAIVPSLAAAFEWMCAPVRTKP